MRVRRYMVNKLEEAKPAILRDLGKDAIIISTNKVKAKGIKGLFGKYHFEVLAAADNKTSTVTQESKIKAKPVTTTEVEPHVKNNELEMIKNELRENQKLLQNVISDLSNVSTNFPEAYEKLFKKLVSQGIIEGKAKKLIQKLQKMYTSDSKINAFLIDGLREIMVNELETIAKPEEISGNYSIALVGPTGVGKTTTLAKIAAHSVLNKQKSVGFITLDNYRIAATEQLKIYGDILDVPVVVANTVNEYAEAMSALNHKEQVFIDTAGRSHKNTEQLLELKKYFDTLALDQTILVFSLSTNFKDLLPIYNTFKIFEPKGLILSKLDEVETYGNIYNIITEFKLPVFYFTTGQSVPEDIVVLNSSQIVSKILDNNTGDVQ